MITVIVPVYCVEPYLRICTASILAQTFRDFELLLVDDGSPDGCPALCDAIAATDARVRVIHQENGGVSAARNAGIRAAKGEYLTFVDADDWIEPDYLSCLLEAMRQSDLAVCGVDADEILCPEEARISAMQLRTTPSKYAANLYTNWVYNKLYVTDLVRRSGAIFPEQMRRGEDACFVAGYSALYRRLCPGQKDAAEIYPRHAGRTAGPQQYIESAGGDRPARKAGGISAAP